jgi:hypothetical protein
MVRVRIMYLCMVILHSLSLFHKAMYAFVFPGVCRFLLLCVVAFE